MTSATARWLDQTLGVCDALAPQMRLRLFRQTRLMGASLALIAFPVLALTGNEPMAVIAALLLAGVLPAAIALDIRKPADLDRAVLASLLVISVVLIAGVLRGLSGLSAVALLGVIGMEACVLLSRSMRLRALAIVGITLAVMARLTAAYPGMALHGLIPAPTPLANLTLVIASLIHGGVLVHALLGEITDKHRSSHLQQQHSLEGEAVIAQTTVTVDRTGSVLWSSSNVERILGLSRESLLGRGLVELVLVSDRPQLLKALCDCALGGYGRTMRLRLRTSASDVAPCYRWVEAVVAPALSDQDCALAALRDISASVAEEERLTNLSAVADKARNARAAFLATVNHELRTPLNAIIGFSEVLTNPLTAPKAVERTQEYAGLINSAGHDLLRLVTLMIDITRLDSGTYEFEAEPTDLKALLETSVEAFRQEPESRGASITITQCATLSESAVDLRAFRQVLQQVLSNAAKFGAKGGPISITLTSDQAWNSIAITDRGPGIAQDKLQMLGRHFERLDESLTREHGGIGLGLALARKLMALHDGRISIASSPGSGTTVTLALPKTGSAPVSQTTAKPNIHALMRPAMRDPSHSLPTEPERRSA